MGLLARIARGTARAGARTAGRALSRHVLPDTLIPSWKTKKIVSSGFSLLSKAARSTPKKKRASTSSATRPGPAKPKQKFDKNAYLQGRALVSADFSETRPPSRSSSSSASSKSKPGYSLARKAKDLVRNPRLVAQMKLDELKHDYQTLKRRYLSDLAETSKRPF